jgi:hypothetical protein
MLKSNARGSENKLGPGSGISGIPYCIDQILVCRQWEAVVGN